MFRKRVGNVLAAVAVLFAAGGAQADTVIDPLASAGGVGGFGNWTGGTGSFVDFGREGVLPFGTTLSFTLPSLTGLTISADDCCVPGDVFGLIVDSVSTPWTTADTTGSRFGSGLFHGVADVDFAAGVHTVRMEVTEDCCGIGSMAWDIRPSSLTPVPEVPEPQTYALMLAGLALTGTLVRRRNRNS